MAAWSSPLRRAATIALGSVLLDVHCSFPASSAAPPRAASGFEALAAGEGKLTTVGTRGSTTHGSRAQ